jgi:hypothetical protein
MRNNNGNDPLWQGLRIQIAMEFLRESEQMHNDARLYHWLSIALKATSAIIIASGCISALEGKISESSLPIVLGAASTIYSSKIAAEASEQQNKAHARINKILEEFKPDDYSIDSVAEMKHLNDDLDTDT